MDVRLLSPHDLPLVTRIFPERDPHQLAGRLSDQSQGLSCFFVAWDDQVPLGYAMSYFVPEGRLPGLRGCQCQSCQRTSVALDALGCPRIVDLLVQSDARRRGVASALLDHIEAFVQSIGADGLVLAVEPGNRGAIELYQRRGFRQIGPEWQIHSRSSLSGRGNWYNIPVWHLRKTLRYDTADHQQSQVLQRLVAEDQAERTQAGRDQVDETGDQRRAQTMERLLATPKRLSADDCYAVAWLRHHSADPRSGQAFAGAQWAVQGGCDPARWLFAAALDRFLVARGEMQHYGTQFHKTWRGWKLHPFRAETTDAERAAWDVPPLDQVEPQATANGMAQNAS
jgi:GNAT superfamily N-acetyltransferase